MVIVWDELPIQHCGYWKLEIKLMMQMYFSEINRYLVAKTWIAGDFAKAIRFSEHLISQSFSHSHNYLQMRLDYIQYLVVEDSGDYTPNTPEDLDLVALVESW